jgi:hypothetical protein
MFRSSTFQHEYFEKEKSENRKMTKEEKDYARWVSVYTKNLQAYCDHHRFHFADSLCMQDIKAADLERFVKLSKEFADREAYLFDKIQKDY